MRPDKEQQSFIKKSWEEILKADGDMGKLLVDDLVKFCEQFDECNWHVSLGIRLWYSKYTGFYPSGDIVPLESRLTGEDIIGMCDKVFS